MIKFANAVLKWLLQLKSNVKVDELEKINTPWKKYPPSTKCLIFKYKCLSELCFFGTLVNLRIEWYPFAWSLG